MSGFEFTPDGLFPLGAYREGQAEGAVAAATAVVPEVTPTALQPRISRPLSAVADVATVAAIRPRDVVRLARARLREVERDIRRIKKLETERDELKRLLAAADNRPLAVVRKMPTRSA
jgi:hypothetical protein